MLRINANAIGNPNANANANANGNAPQDQGAAGQEDQAMHAAQAQPHPAAANPGDQQLQLGGPLGGPNFDAPANPMFMQPHLGGPGGGVHFNAPVNHALFPHLGGPGAGGNLDAAGNPALFPHLGGPGGLHGQAAPMMGRGFGAAPLMADVSPAQLEVDQLLRGYHSPQFFEFYIEPSQRFINDRETGCTALMLAAGAGDSGAVSALMSKTILLRRESDGYVSDYYHHICDDERERRGLSRNLVGGGPVYRDGGYVNIPTPAGLPSSIRIAGDLLRETVNARALDGRAPLMFAAAGGNVVVAEKLLSKGANIHACAQDGRSALSFAAENGHAGMVDFLMENGAFRSQFTPIDEAVDGMAFTLAARNGHIEVVRILLNEIPVLTACRNIELARQLTEEKYSEPAVNEMLSEARREEEMLISAAKEKNLQSLGKIIEGKSPAWLNAALRTACGHGLADAVKLLINSGADVNAKTKVGQTALLAAVEYGHAEVVKQLLEKGAAVNKRAAKGCGVLSAAVQVGEPQTLRYLLAHLSIEPQQLFLSNHRIPSEQDDAAAALNIAAARGSVDIVRMLFDETPGKTYAPLQILKARELAQAAGKTVAVELLDGFARIARMSSAVVDSDLSSPAELKKLIKSGVDINVTLGKKRLNPLLAMLEDSTALRKQMFGISAAKINHYEEVGEILLRAGVDATVRNEVGDSVLKLAALARAHGLANQIILSGQCQETAGDDVRSVLLKSAQQHFLGNTSNVDLKGHSSLLDWLVFSAPVAEQAAHYEKLESHGVWPQDKNNAIQRDIAIRKAAEKGCAGVVLALGGTANKDLVKELMLLAAKNGSWNVIKALCDTGWEDALDKNIMQTALKSAVTHRQHAAVDDIFRLNELLSEKYPLPRGRTLLKQDIEAAFKLAIVNWEDTAAGSFQTDFRMVERLIRSAPRALLPEGMWLNGASQPLGKKSLQLHEAWAMLDHLWYAQGVSDVEKNFLQPHARWPLDEQDVAQISSAIEAAARSGCPNIFWQLYQLPAFAQWRKAEENATAFTAMMQRVALAAAEGQNHNMFEPMAAAIA